MTRIGIISDTHGWLDEQIYMHFHVCDEIWHAGDFGSLTIAEQLKSFKPLRGVFGNIDDHKLRLEYPEQLVFTCEKIKVMIRHIGGYPPRYNPESKKQLQLHRPGLFITGHSHILKIMFDQQLQCLHINPGAAGKQGWQKVRTAVTLTIDGTDMKDCAVIELGKM